MLENPLYTGKEPFKAPAGYFHTLPERVLDRIRQEQPVPRLDTIPRQNSWKVPAGYFDVLPERIARSVAGESDRRPEITAVAEREGAGQRIAADPRTDVSRTPVFRLKKYIQTGIAACLVAGMSILGVLQIVGKSDTLMNSGHNQVAGSPEYLEELPMDVLEMKEELFVEHYLQTQGYTVSSNSFEEYAVEYIEEDLLLELY